MQEKWDYDLLYRWCLPNGRAIDKRINNDTNIQKYKIMKVLFMISHPAHFHMLKNSAKALNKNGHDVYFVINKKPDKKRAY